MSKQVGFFAAETDYQELIDLAEQLGCSAIPAIIPTDSIPEATRPSQFNLPEAHSYLYLLPPGISPSEAFYQETTNDPSLSILMPHVSAVIQLIPSHYIEKALHDGRLFVGLNPKDRFFKQVDRIYSRIARHIRTWELIAEHQLYVGPKAAELARTCAVQLKYQFLPVVL